MIPMNQQDYIRYQQALKGNRVKGAELFRSLLEDARIAPVFAGTQAAAGVVFTDCGKTINRTLPRLLNETPYAQSMVLAYVNAGIGTAYGTLREAAADSRFVSVFHGRDIGELPLVMEKEYRKILSIPDIALGYSEPDSKYAIAAAAQYINTIGMSAVTVTFSETYSWQWSGTYVPNRGWYVFGAYTTEYNGTRTARAWRITGTSAVSVFSSSAQQEYIAACYHPVQDRIYAFRTTNTTASTSGAGINRQPEAQLFLDIFKINSSGTLSRESTSTIGANVNVFEILFDPNRKKLVCVGNASPSFTFAGTAYTHPRTYSVPVLMIGDKNGWTVKLQYAFSRSPNSYMVRRMSLDKSSGNIIFPMAFNTSFVLKPDNSIREVIVNTPTGNNYTFGNVCISVERNKWIVNYITANSSSSLNPYLLELNDDCTLKSFTRLMSSQLNTVCYDPMTRYLGMLAGSYYAYNTQSHSLTNYAYSVITGLTTRYIFVSHGTAETMSLEVGSEVNNYQTPNKTTKIRIIKPNYWKEDI